MRKIHTTTGPKGKAIVYRDSEWNEYRVKFYSLEGKHHAGADYHTDDKADAVQTAETAVK